MQVTDLIRYNHFVRDLYFDAISKLPWAQVVEARGLSFGSMRNVFSHLTRVEDRVVNYVIPERDKDWVGVDFDAFKNMDSLKDYMLHVKENTENYLADLSAEELNRQIIIPWEATSETKISVETVLNHIVLEDMIHYGELSAVFWQMGLQAPYIALWQNKLQHTLG